VVSQVNMGTVLMMELGELPSTYGHSILTLVNPRKRYMDATPHGHAAEARQSFMLPMSVFPLYRSKYLGYHPSLPDPC